MRRVSVIGGSCSGKTTLARVLAGRLGVPHIELDALNHGPEWDQAPAEVMRDRVLTALASAEDGWVVDGTYYGKLGSLVLERADTVVWLDIPYATAVRRVVIRTWTRLVRRTELWNGNRERLRDTFGRYSIIWYVLTTYPWFARVWPGRLARHPDLKVVRLRSQRAVDVWLQSIQATATMSGSSGSSERQNTPPFVDT